MTKTKEVEFKHEDKTYKVQSPTARQQLDGKKVYIKAWGEARKQESILRPNLKQFLQENGIWSQEDEAELSKLDQKIIEIEDLLQEPGDASQDDLVKRANECLSARLERHVLLSRQLQYDGLTAEAQAENAQFGYLLSACLKNEDGSPVFPSYDAYLDSMETELVELASEKLTELMYGVSLDTMFSDTPEYRFLEENAQLEDEKREEASKSTKKAKEVAHGKTATKKKTAAAAATAK